MVSHRTLVHPPRNFLRLTALWKITVRHLAQGSRPRLAVELTLPVILISTA